MPKDLFEGQSIEIPCPGCGEKTIRSLESLRNDTEYVCAGCGETIRPDAEKLFKGLDDAQAKARKMVADLAKKFR
jgi:DNA-directed RNA polymerase subunit RPC12/RpoP